MIIDHLLTVFGFKTDQAQLNDTVRRIDRVRMSLDRVSTAFTIAGTALSGALYKVGNTILGFETAQNNLQATLNLTTKQMKGLREQALLLGRTTRYTASQVTDAQTKLAQQGYKVNEVLSLTPTTLNLAAAGNLDMADSAALLSGQLRRFNLDVTHANRLADVLAHTARSAATSVQELTPAIRPLGVAPRVLGLSPEETMAMVATLRNAQLQPETAGTALRQTFVMMSRILEEESAVQEWEELGVNARKVQDMLRAGNVMEVFELLGDSVLSANKGAEALAAADKLFGAEAGIGALVIAQSLGDVKELTAAYADNVGAAERMANIQEKGIVGAFYNMMSAIEGLQLAIGEAGLTQWITMLVELIVDLTRAVADASPAMQLLAVVIGGGVPALLGLSVLLRFIAISLGAWVGLFKLLTSPFRLTIKLVRLLATGLFKFLIPYTFRFSVAIGRATVGLLRFATKALVAAIAGTGRFYRVLRDRNVPILSTLIRLIEGTIRVMWRLVTWPLRAAISGFRSLGLLITRTLVPALVSMTRKIWLSTVAMLASPTTWLVTGILAVVAALILAIVYWDKIEETVTGFWDSISKHPAVGTLSGFFTGLLGSFMGLFGTNPDTGELNIVTSIRDAITEVENFLTGIDWTAHGEALLGTLKDGIHKARLWLWNKVWGILKFLRDLLPFSDAKVGPLSDLLASGRSLIQTLMNGIEEKAGELIAGFLVMLETIRLFLTTFSLKDAAATAWDTMLEWFKSELGGEGPVVTAVKNAFNAVFNWLIGSEVYQSLSSAASYVWSALVSWFTSEVAGEGPVVTAVTKAFNAAKAWLLNPETHTMITDAAESVWKGLTDWFTSELGGEGPVVTAVKDAFSAVWNWLVGSEVYQTISDAADYVWSALKGWFVTDDGEQGPLVKAVVGAFNAVGTWLLNPETHTMIKDAATDVWDNLLKWFDEVDIVGKVDEFFTSAQLEFDKHVLHVKLSLFPPEEEKEGTGFWSKEKWWPDVEDLPELGDDFYRLRPEHALRKWFDNWQKDIEGRGGLTGVIADTIDSWTDWIDDASGLEDGRTWGDWILQFLFESLFGDEHEYDMDKSLIENFWDVITANFQDWIDRLLTPESIGEFLGAVIWPLIDALSLGIAGFARKAGFRLFVRLFSGILKMDWLKKASPAAGALGELVDQLSPLRRFGKELRKRLDDQYAKDLKEMELDFVNDKELRKLPKESKDRLREMLKERYDDLYEEGMGRQMMLLRRQKGDESIFASPFNLVKSLISAGISAVIVGLQSWISDLKKENSEVQRLIDSIQELLWSIFEALIPSGTGRGLFQSYQETVERFENMDPSQLSWANKLFLDNFRNLDEGNKFGSFLSAWLGYLGDFWGGIGYWFTVPGLTELFEGDPETGEGGLFSGIKKWLEGEFNNLIAWLQTDTGVLAFAIILGLQLAQLLGTIWDVSKTALNPLQLGADLIDAILQGILGTEEGDKLGLISQLFDKFGEYFGLENQRWYQYGKDLWQSFTDGLFGRERTSITGMAPYTNTYTPFVGEEPGGGFNFWRGFNRMVGFGGEFLSNPLGITADTAQLLWMLITGGPGSFAPTGPSGPYIPPLVPGGPFRGGGGGGVPSFPGQRPSQPFLRDSRTEINIGTLAINTNSDNPEEFANRFTQEMNRISTKAAEDSDGDIEE